MINILCYISALVKKKLPSYFDKYIEDIKKATSLIQSKKANVFIG